MTAVLDASVVVELVLGTRIGARIRERLHDPRISLHGPELLDLEVLNVLRRYVRAGTVAADRAEAGVRRLGRARSPAPSTWTDAAANLVVARQPHRVRRGVHRLGGGRRLSAPDHGCSLVESTGASRSGRAVRRPDNPLVSRPLGRTRFHFTLRGCVLRRVSGRTEDRAQSGCSFRKKR